MYRPARSALSPYPINIAPAPGTQQRASGASKTHPRSQIRIDRYKMHYSYSSDMHDDMYMLRALSTPLVVQYSYMIDRAFPASRRRGNDSRTNLFFFYML